MGKSLALGEEYGRRKSESNMMWKTFDLMKSYEHKDEENYSLNILTKYYYSDEN